jgi:lysine biosynthesis protein LysW
VPECPECGSEVRVARNVKVGDQIECSECGETLEVISTRPIELDYVLEDEDWDDDEWDDDDDDWDDDDDDWDDD